MTIRFPKALSMNVDDLIRNASLHVLGQDDIGNKAQEDVVRALLRAYGDNPGGFLYIEPCTARSTTRPPDALLVLEGIGVLVIEVKGHDLSVIEAVEAGSLQVRTKGFVRPMNPFHQADACMFQIKNAVERKLADPHRCPLFNRMVALPNIQSSDWVAKGFGECIQMNEVLFRDDIGDSKLLGKKIALLIASTMQRSGLTVPVDSSQLETIKAVFGDSATINESRNQEAASDELSLGAHIDELASLEKYLSQEQQAISRLPTAAHPRLIRGVAGSGKTIVLGNQVARMIQRRVTSEQDLFEGHKNLRVAVVCFNRALVSFIRDKTNLSYKQQTMESLPGRYVFFSHLNGLLKELCKNSPVAYLMVPLNPDPGDRAAKYRNKIAKFKAEQPDKYDSVAYDAIFVDEGQDFHPEEYRLLLDMIRKASPDNEKALTIFYDDAQNLYGQPRPNWGELGINVIGTRSRVMKECFRNTKQIIELAFNVLLGTKATQQAQTRTFADVNDLTRRDLVSERADGTYEVKFAERTYLDPEIREFSNRTEELEWLLQEIRMLINEHCVRPEDILVLFHKTTQYRDITSQLEPLKEDGLIEGFITPYGESPDRDAYIFRKGWLTVGTTKGCKGYDAFIVFIIGCNDFTPNREGRASFYVGATRAKLLLYLSGVAAVGSLLNEARDLLKGSQLA
jgi:superfamily I DNA and RNA helicase